MHVSISKTKAINKDRAQMKYNTSMLVTSDHNSSYDVACAACHVSVHLHYTPDHHLLIDIVADMMDNLRRHCHRNYSIVHHTPTVDHQVVQMDNVDLNTIHINNKCKY
jgi:hypothetical protein